MLLLAMLCATRFRYVRLKNGRTNENGQWINDLLAVGSVIMLLGIGITPILSAFDLLPAQAADAILEEIKANGIALTASFLYAGGVIAVSLRNTMTPRPPSPRPPPPPG